MIMVIDQYIGEQLNEWGEDIGIRAQRFCSSLADYSGNRSIDIEINSYGGNVAEALQMFNAIKQTPNCNTLNVGIAASASSFLLLAGKKVRMMENALIMIHKARAKYDATMTAEELRKEADAIDKVNEAMATIYEGKTGKPKEEWLKMMENDYWIDASEALELGLVDEVITFDGKKKKLSKQEAAAMGPEKVYYAFYPNTYTNQFPMKEKILVALALTATAGETEILASIASLAKAAKDGEAKATDLEAKLKLKEVELEKLQENNITALVEGAVAAGKITADMKDAWTKSAKTDYVNTKAILDSMAARTTVASQIQATTSADPKASWSYDEWQKKDSAGLLKMKQEQPEKFTKLFEAHYGKA